MVGNIAIGIGVGGTISSESGSRSRWATTTSGMAGSSPARALGHCRGPWATYGQGVHTRHDEGQELQSAGQPGENAELMAINRTQTGVCSTALSLIFLLIVLDMI